MLLTDTLQFEKVENKAAVVGYAAAAVGALVFSEWLIHLPVIYWFVFVLLGC